MRWLSLCILCNYGSARIFWVRGFTSPWSPNQGFSLGNFLPSFVFLCTIRTVNCRREGATRRCVVDSAMSSTQNIDDVDGEVSSHCIATLRFPDDFAEFKARADSGGSTYGILKRHAFAQQSLRVVPPSDPEVNVVVPQRRANSLVPPSSSSPDPEASGDTADAADQKMLIAVLCDQSSQQRRQRYHHNQHLKHQRSNQHHRQQSEQSAVKMDTLQVHRLHGQRSLLTSTGRHGSSAWLRHEGDDKPALFNCFNNITATQLYK